MGRGGRMRFGDGGMNVGLGGRDGGSGREEVNRKSELVKGKGYG